MNRLIALAARNDWLLTVAAVVVLAACHPH
jgi:hypothetical protein